MEAFIKQIFYKKTAVFLLYAIARHGPAYANDLVDAGYLEKITNALKDIDPDLKEMAACALSYIAKYDPSLATRIDSADLQNFY